MLHARQEKEEAISNGIISICSDVTLVGSGGRDVADRFQISVDTCLKVFLFL